MKYFSVFLIALVLAACLYSAWVEDYWEDQARDLATENADLLLRLTKCATDRGMVAGAIGIGTMVSGPEHYYPIECECPDDYPIKVCGFRGSREYCECVTAARLAEIEKKIKEAGE